MLRVWRRSCTKRMCPTTRLLGEELERRPQAWHLAPCRPGKRLCTGPGRVAGKPPPVDPFADVPQRHRHGVVRVEVAVVVAQPRQQLPEDVPALRLHLRLAAPCRRRHRPLEGVGQSLRLVGDLVGRPHRLHRPYRPPAQQPGDRRSHVPCCIPDALVKAWRASPRGWRRHEKRRGAADGREGPRHVPRPVKAPSVVHDGDAAGDERIEDRATRRRVCPHGDGTRAFQRGLWDVMVAERLGFESQGGYRQTA